MTNPNNWPDPDKPGVPLNPDKDGWHWCGVYSSFPFPIVWRHDGIGFRWENGYSPEQAAHRWRYLGPCLTPAEVAVREQAARLEAMEEAAQPQVISVIDEIADERRRQTDVEGWTLEHDDEHVNGEMAQAAAAYTFCAIGRYPGNRQTNIPIRWPWSTTSWKPREPRRDLIRAAALIVAEIERLDRAAAKEVNQ